MSQKQRYKGFKPFKMDPKFRVSIPPHWRPEADAIIYMQSSTRHELPCVKAFTQEIYDEKVERIINSTKTPADKDELLGALAMRCREAVLNEQGKLLVPKDLSARTGIEAEADVMLAGRGMHFEIWSKANFERMMEFEARPTVIDDLGIF